jgi:hypothetical protein
VMAFIVGTLASVPDDITKEVKDRYVEDASAKYSVSPSCRNEKGR